MSFPFAIFRPNLSKSKRRPNPQIEYLDLANKNENGREISLETI